MVIIMMVHVKMTALVQSFEHCFCSTTFFLLWLFSEARVGVTTAPTHFGPWIFATLPSTTNATNRLVQFTTQPRGSKQVQRIAFGRVGALMFSQYRDEDKLRRRNRFALWSTKISLVNQVRIRSHSSLSGITEIQKGEIYYAQKGYHSAEIDLTLCVYLQGHYVIYVCTPSSREEETCDSRNVKLHVSSSVTVSMYYVHPSSKGS